MKPLDDAEIKHILDAKRPRGGAVGFVLRTLRIGLQAVLSIAILAGAYYLTESLIASRPDVAKRAPRERVYTIETAAVERTAHQPTIAAYGQIVAGRTVDLRALVAGTVTGMHPDLRRGATIEAGDVLVTVDDFDYVGALTEAEANLLEAEARLAESRARLVLERDAQRRADEQLAFAVQDRERVAALHERGRVTDRDLEDRQLLVSQREEMVEQRRNTIAIEEARRRQQEAAITRLEWGVRDARRNLEDTALKAPFTGVVLTETVEIGRVLNANDIALTLYESNSLEARFQLTDRHFGDILADAGTIVGRPVEILWNVGDDPVRSRGSIVRAGAEITASRGGVEVFAAIDPETLTAAIRPGAFVEIRIPGRRLENTVRLPEASVYNRDHVFIVEGERLVRRDVAILGYDGNAVYVTGDLEDGDTVLVTRIAEVGEGLKVRLQSDETPETMARGEN